MTNLQSHVYNSQLIHWPIKAQNPDENVIFIWVKYGNILPPKMTHHISLDKHYCWHFQIREPSLFTFTKQREVSMDGFKDFDGFINYVFIVLQNKVIDE